MNIEFPHLDDTKFPGVNNEDTLSGVDVYKYQNDFDYYRWRNQVSVKLLNVLWNSNYADVPYFESDNLRDKWFDEQEGIIQPLLTPFNSTPETNIQLPLPYNDAYKYNYIVVDMPLQTSANEPLDYENTNTRVKRWYYFIEDIIQLAPNTTQFVLRVDYWTNFIHSVEINYLMLERGHAPMTKVSVDDYLENPLANSEYLLADDFNYQRGESIIRASSYTPIGNGTKYVLFAAPIKQADFALFGGTTLSGNSTPPRYTNTGDRYGYQLTVHDYDWKYGEVDYSNANLPVRGTLGQDNLVFNGCYVYAIRANEAEAFFDLMAKYRVHFIHAIQAIFVLDESMFNRGEPFTFMSQTIYQCYKNQFTQDFTFTKNAFGFDSKYKEIAKLYTSPYSFLEFTDDNGNTFNINIENCGSSFQMHREVALTFPFIRYNIFLTGVNGSGQFNYTWKNLNDSNVSKTMWESDFAKYMMNWDIPTYSLYVSSEAEFAANNAADIQNKRAKAIKDYKNATRLANTARENMADSMQTNTDNVAATGLTNNENTENIQKGLRNNMQRENDTYDLIVDHYQNDGSFGSALDATGYLAKTAWRNFEKVSDDADTDWTVIQEGFDVNAQYAAGMAALNAGTAIGAGIGIGVSGLITAASAGTTAPVAPVISGVVSGITTEIAVGMTITNNQNLKNIQQSAIQAKIRHARTQSEELYKATKQYNGDVKDANNDLREDNTLEFSDTLNNQGINNVNTNRTTNTNNANAERTQTTETNNATYLRNVNHDNYDADLVQAQKDAETLYKNNRLRKPIISTQSGGDAFPDIWQRRGVRLNIRTQTEAAIRQAGDGFLRFGYALHRVWDMSQGFNYMKHFTFWKAEDIWINDGSGVANIATNTIGDILLKGVTVWKNPNEIGMVSIYDN